eukprot:128187_1
MPISRLIANNPLKSFDSVSAILISLVGSAVIYKTIIRNRNKKKMLLKLAVLYTAYRLAKFLMKQYKLYKIKSSSFKPRIVIIGAGFSGLCMAIKLKHELGYDNFIIYEMLNDLGGTWYANTYPGCCCDVAGDLYSYSFEPNPDAKRAYPTQPETLEYIRRVATKYDLAKHIQFNSQVIGSKYNTKTSEWTVEIKELNNNKIELIKCNFVVSCTGLLVIPKYPNINNFNKYKGKIIHSAEWDHKYDFTNKKIAVIGTGCSAIQVVPTLLETYKNKIKQLHVYQRTPGHIFPKEDFEHSKLRQFLYKYVPFVLKIKRYFLYWRHDFLLFPALYKNSPHNIQFTELGNEYRKTLIKDDELRKKVTPDFPFGAKRILIEYGYYTALQLSNAGLITDRIDSLIENGIKTVSGKNNEYDCIIFCTGYETEEFLKSLPNGVVNIDKNIEIKKDIFKVTDAKAYIGRSVAHFPNWFNILGPGSGLGHSSMILIIENDCNYILQIFEKFILSNGKYKSIEVKEKCMNEFVDKMDEQMNKMVWTDENTNSWYKNRHQRVAALWAWSTVYHWWLSRTVEWNHYILR